jgi:hypothetical protein
MCRRIEQINFNYCRDQPLGHFFALSALGTQQNKFLSPCAFVTFVTTCEGEPFSQEANTDGAFQVGESTLRQERDSRC